jgi:hypothetical protein
MIAPTQPLSVSSERRGLEHWLWRSMVITLVSLAVGLVSLGVYLYIPLT